MVAFKLPDLPQNWREQPQLFERYWTDAMRSIVQAINDITATEAALQVAIDQIIAAQAAAAAAQVAADAAQTTANSAETTANGAVPKNAGVPWTDPLETASRGALPIFAGVGPFTVSNPPTQAEVQAIGTALGTVSTALIANNKADAGIIIDLKANGALT